jgi:hypothetical protein
MSALLDGTLSVEISDPIAQQQVTLASVPADMSVGECLAAAVAQMHLPEGVEWSLREESTSRLLPDDTQLGSVARADEPLQLVLQPDAGLG